MLPLADRLALVVPASPAGESKLHFGFPLPEVHRQRHQRQPLLGDGSRDAVDLPAVHEQLAGPLRVVPSVAGERVRRDVGVLQPQFAAPDFGVGVLEVDVPGPQALHLRPHQRDPGLERVDDLVVVAGPAVGGDDLAAHGAPLRGRAPG